MPHFSYTMKGDGTEPVALDDLPKIAGALDAELVGWFTTASPAGQPQSSAVWFLREGDTLLMYSRPDATRRENLVDNPRVAFNLRGDPQGDFVVTLEATAHIDDAAPAANDHPAYLEKYGAEIVRLGWTPESFAEEYSMPIRITVRRIRSWWPED